MITLDDRTFKFEDTTATQKVFALTRRIRAVAGGTSASKTISILVWCIDYAQTTRGKLVSIVSESYPHLEKGAMLDFELIMKDRGYWNDARWNKTKHTYTFESGTKIEFFSVDSYSKAHGPRRDVLYINEANSLPYTTVDQLIVRTREIVWLDWNPTEEFWFYTEMQPNRKDIDFLTLTYLDNEALDAVTIQEIESHRNNKNWWTVYALGQLGATEARIYRGWGILDEVPQSARLIRRWLDYGYAHDPAAIGAVYKWNDAYVLDEELYRTGMKNGQLAEFLLNLEEQVPVAADSAEPKSNDELDDRGVTIIPAKKGADSVRNGINYVQSLKIFVTKRSTNIIKESRNYLWMTDKDGKILPVPTPGNDHHLDGIRYAFGTLGDALTPEKARIQRQRTERNRERIRNNGTR